jgi:hypothetical protein
VAVSALSGAVVGHSLTYVLAVRNANLRQALLQATGHGYWPAAVAGAIVLGSISLVSIAREHLAGEARADERSHAGVVAWFAVLGPLQLAIFLVQEVLERVAEHVALSGLIQQHVIQFGIPAQLVIAFVFALILRGTAEAAEAAARAMRHPIPTRRAPAAYPEPLITTLTNRLVAHSGESRAPPLRLA